MSSRNTVFCPGCGKIYDGRDLQIGHPLRCNSGHRFGKSGIRCGYTFVAFEGGERGKRKAMEAYRREWTLYQKHVFEKPDIDRWFIVYWQQTFHRYQPRGISELLGASRTLKFLIDGMTATLHVPFSICQHDQAFLPSFETAKYHLTEECLAKYRSGVCDSERRRDYEEISAEIRGGYQPFRLCCENGIHWRYRIRVGTEVIGVGVGGCLLFEDKDINPRENPDDPRVRAARDILLMPESRVASELAEFPSVHFKCGDGKGGTLIVDLKEYYTRYRVFSSVMSEITEIARSCYDRRRKPSEEMFLRELVSRVERKYEEKLDPDQYWVRLQEALRRTTEFFDLSRIAYFTNVYHENYLTPRIDSRCTPYKPEGRRAIGHRPHPREVSFSIFIRDNQDLRRLLESRRTCYIDSALEISGDTNPTFSKERASAALQNFYERDDRVICIAPINISVFGPTDIGLLVFYANNDHFVAHRELYERIIAILGVLFRCNYAEERRRDEYWRAIHEILEPHGAIKTRLDIARDAINGIIRSNTQLAKCALEIDSETKIRTMLTDSLHFADRLEYITDKIGLKLGGEPLVPDREWTPMYPLFTSAYGQLRDRAREKGMKILLENLRARMGDDLELYVDKRLLEQAIFHTVSNAIKYSFDGTRIRFGYETVSQDNTIFHVFSVHNTGVPIPADEVDRVFYRYTRGSNANFLDVRGSGEGCFVASEILHVHNGFYRYTEGDNPDDVGESQNPKRLDVREIIFKIGLPDTPSKRKRRHR